ncbi:hypothetical protein B0J17DRAFT_768612 [Rhizoctonia solani]|nr:hypothetical protein B0J17DRAFT_768612 [Rhizoctonia solani]
MSTSQRISAYALIIAIGGHGLAAPESDAHRLRNVFIKLGFPADQVELLLGAKATRRAIIEHLHKISRDPKIKKNSPIFIYFAGHGVRQGFPVPRVGTVEAECILPYDTFTTRGQVLPIPDITISALLGEIAEAKGDYITLLFDCCHSGSGSRDSGIGKNRDSVLEDLNFDQDRFKDEDGDLWFEFIKASEEADTGHNSRSISTSNPGSLRYQGIKSHVLIASCRENEESFEFSRRGQPPTGLFTASLIEALEDCRKSNMIWNVTYVGLFTRIKDFMQDLDRGHHFPQTPQCEGYHRERHVFATPLFPHRNHAIAPITEIAGRPGQYLLPVGELAGVRAESEFEIWDYSRGQPYCKGRFRVSGVDNVGSMTTINGGQDLQLSPDAYAVLCILPSPLPIDLSPELHQIWNSQELQTDLVKRLNARYSINYFIAPVRPGHPSTLRISRSTSTGGVKIEPTNGRSHPIILRNLRIPLLSDTLAKAVMFYYHLESQVISQEANPLVFQALELIESAPNDPNYLGILSEDNRQRPITFRPNEETHIYNSDSEFGLRIENRAKQALYIYIFYFNPNDFSITPIYLPPTDQPSVLPRSLFQIGYGNSGAPPLTFTIDRNLNTDPGFFKIYYSISPSEMSTIQQDGVEPNQSADPRAEPHYQPSIPPFGSVLYPMAVLNSRPRH